MLETAKRRTGITAEDWTLGNPNAPITMLEYGDFECPFCTLAAPVLESIIADNAETVRLIYRHFPLSTMHPHAVLAAEAAEAAGVQGEFWPMHNVLFAHQSQLEPDHLIAYAAHIGLDVKRFTLDLSAHVYLGDVQKDFQRGIQDGVNGTPTLFINDVRYDGPRERPAILAALRAVNQRIGFAGV